MNYQIGDKVLFKGYYDGSLAYFGREIGTIIEADKEARFPYRVHFDNGRELAFLREDELEFVNKEDTEIIL